MWQQKASALIVALIIVMGMSSVVFGATTTTQNITETISAISGQGTDAYQTVGETVNTIQAQANDGFSAVTNFIATILGQSCNGLASPNENIGLLQGNHTVGQTLGSAASGSYSSSVLLQCGPLIIVVPCNFFQLQCWWFPVLFMLSFTGALMFVAMVLRAPQKGKSHIFLSGLTFSSLLLVILGAMNIVLPLILIILNIINVLRLRG